ncbi:carboxypeptidase-like regulatory domain-containing protein [Flammeovirga kamogawensis]|uniref:Carboxypeptidase-like regulatory domain-containing protein n=1 Tax=Flammeovirga kamogawensis TaxID=373891 RepID=A0ABX8GSX7_9BACT|nr:carboxypeptidase-like regulatory domain-containing protein [Flammeovirga kamogawensis]MBB6461357.1 hypothetical protein [Flammeovirga kamogawensis]QWG06262.1 carboxypeptidase-like regulatory domain-containing protein [Flammeovirga kamogawensis]
MNKKLSQFLIIAFLIFNFSSFAQEKKKFDYIKNRESLIQDSFAGSKNIDVENWLFEFSCIDTLLTKGILGNNIEKKYALQLDSIYLYNENDRDHLEGKYIAECKDISGKNYKTEEELKKRVDQFVNAFKGLPLNLIGIGYVGYNINEKPKSFLQNNDNLIKAIIKNSNNESIPFVSIGIIGTEYSTISDQEGNFRLKVPTLKEENTLVTFRHLGYKEQQILLSDLIHLKKITLQANEELLEEVIVKDDLGNIKRKIIGDKGKTHTFGGIQATKNEGIEIAKRFDTKKQKIYLNSIGVYISNIYQNDFTLLVNIYEEKAETALPGKSLLKQQVIVSSNLQKGWLKINMNEYNIMINKPFYISFQWTTDDVLTPSIGISGKQGLFRKSSFNEWIDSEKFKWMIQAEVTYIKNNL